MLTNKHGVDLDVTQQRDLARWAVIKALLMEHHMRKQDPKFRAMDGYAPSEAELAWLMTSADPPPRSRVWLGAFDAEGRYLINTQARLLTSPPVPGGSDPVPAHMTTLTIGCVLLQVFSTDFVLAEAQSLPAYDADPPSPYNEALSRIWPIKNQVVDWPPSHYVTQAVFDKVVNWGQGRPRNDMAVAGASRRNPAGNGRIARYGQGMYHAWAAQQLREFLDYIDALRALQSAEGQEYDDLVVTYGSSDAVVDRLVTLNPVMKELMGAARPDLGRYTNIPVGNGPSMTARTGLNTSGPWS